MAGVFSFADVNVAISGPFLGSLLLSDSGVAEEGISIEMDGDKVTTLTGASGDIMHSVHKGQTGVITLRLHKTSPKNKILMDAYNYQNQSSAFAGQNVLSLTNVVAGDGFSVAEAAFVKAPNLTWANDANVNEWQFRGRVNGVLGARSQF